MSTRPRYKGGDAKPTTCLHGHAYTPENTRAVTNDTGRKQRRCRTCERASGRAYAERRKERSGA